MRTALQVGERPYRSSNTRQAQMYFEYLDDPGAKLRSRARLELSGECEDEDDAGSASSIFEKWSFVIEKLWYVGHITVMTLSMISILTCLTRQVLKPWPRLLYRSTFVVAFFTYTVSLLQNLNGATPGFYALLPLGTFQFMILSALWVVTIPHTIKLIPFSLYSLLHVADAASSHHAESKSRKEISNKLSDSLAPKVIELRSYLDMWLLVELVRDCILIRPGAVVSLIVYVFFFRVQLMCSPLAHDAFMNVYHEINKFMIRDSTPKKLRDLWIRFRNKVEPGGVAESTLYNNDTDNAIEMTNIFDSLN